jgi:two-component system chemotaxis response regulator CheB
MIKILIVDDSETEIALIKQIIAHDPSLNVVGVARNGKEAVEQTGLLKPDLITMDIQMPIMDGLEATRQIMSEHPTPIVVISSTVNNDSLNATYHILEAGALIALPKPKNIFSPQFESERKNIISTLKSMAEIRVARRRIKPNVNVKTFIPPSSSLKGSLFDLVVIGVSVGGPLALKTIFSQLPAEFPVPIVIVQHMAVGFLSGYVKWLDDISPLLVKEAENHEVLKKGTIYVAPDSHHFEVERMSGKLCVKLRKGDLVDGFCPSITVLMNSVALACNKYALGVLLTGMGSDGATGLLEIKNAGGHTIIQDRESAIVFGMAGVAQSLGAVDKVVPLDKMAEYLVHAAS